jgi:hypothetical protein
MRTALAFFTTLLVAAVIVHAGQWVPFLPYETQSGNGDATEAFDHLRPAEVRTGVLYYLAYYEVRPSFESGYQMLLLRDDKTGKCSLKVSSNHDGKDGASRALEKDIEVEVPAKLAAIVYEMWSNAILEARYTRRDTSGLDGTDYYFSTFVLGLGWMGGRTWSPHLELPPKWMVDAGNYLVAYARKPNREPDEAIRDFQRRRTQLFDYLKKNGRH